MGFKILIVHTDSGVADSQNALILVEIQIDTRLEVQRLVRLLGQGQVLELVERIGSVRDKLPEKDLRMGIERVNNQVQQLIDFSLEFSFGHELLILIKGRCLCGDGRRLRVP